LTYYLSRHKSQPQFKATKIRPKCTYKLYTSKNTLLFVKWGPNLYSYCNK